MTRVLSLLILLGTVALSNLQSSGQEAVPKLVIENTRYMTGQWTAEVELDGKKRQIQMTIEPMPGDVGYTIHWTGPGGPGKSDTQITGIGGWEREKNIIRETCYAANGDAFVFDSKLDSLNSCSGTGAGIYMGEKMTEDLKVERPSRDEFTTTFSNIVVGGQKQENEVYHYKRVVGSDVSKKEASRADFDEFREMFNGRWTGKITWVDDWPGIGKRGEEAMCYFDLDRAADGNALLGDCYVGNGVAVWVTSYDSSARRIKSTYVDSGGSRDELSYYKSNGVWIEEARGSLADGRKTLYKGTIEPTDDGKTLVLKGNGTVAGVPSDPRNDVWKLSYPK